QGLRGVGPSAPAVLPPPPLRGTSPGRDRRGRRRPGRDREVPPPPRKPLAARGDRRGQQARFRGGSTGMTKPRNPDATVAAWLEDGPVRLPHETRSAIVVALRIQLAVRREGIPAGVSPS